MIRRRSGGGKGTGALMIRICFGGDKRTGTFRSRIRSEGGYDAVPYIVGTITGTMLIPIPPNPQ